METNHQRNASLELVFRVQSWKYRKTNSRVKGQSLKNFRYSIRRMRGQRSRKNTDITNVKGGNDMRWRNW